LSENEVTLKVDKKQLALLEDKSEFQ